MIRTNIVLDVTLVEQARKLTGIKTKKELIHEACSVCGKLHGGGDLDELRQLLDHKVHKCQFARLNFYLALVFVRAIPKGGCGFKEMNVMDILIRNETENDYRAVEEITREAFWNLYFPGCHEHYLVHIMRDHADFLKELDFVAECDGKIVGNIMYTKAWLVDETGKEMDIVSFGPISVLPEYQRTRS
ncbi:MAG: Acetyltransferase [Chloroflexi bacterium]|nr:Acetyltransferase [Chloroflexota bacterium]